MRVLLIALLAAISYAQTDYHIIEDLASAGKTCTQYSWSVNECAHASQMASSLGLSSGACDLSTYKKHCSSMDQVTDMSMTNCGTQTMKFFYTECTVCTAAGQTCVNSPGQTDSGNNDSGDSGDPKSDSCNMEQMTQFLGALMVATTPECKTIQESFNSEQTPTNKQACDCFNSGADFSALKTMDCKMGDANENVSTLVNGGGPCSSSSALSLFFAVAALFFSLA